MRGIKKSLIFLILAATIQPTQALETRSYAIGRYWGEDPIDETEKEEPRTPQKITPSKPSARQVLSHLTEIIDEAKAKAVLHPTVENVKHFMVLKNKTGSMATRFSQTWQEVLLQQAHLDYSAFKPINNQGIMALNQQRQLQIENALKTAAKKMGLLYFYEGDDPIAQLQAPIIARVAKKYHFELLGVRLDENSLSCFEKNTFDNGQAKRMGVQKVPALFALVPATHESFPISYTLLAERELEQRLFDVLNHVEAWQ